MINIKSKQTIKFTGLLLLAGASLALAGCGIASSSSSASSSGASSNASFLVSSSGITSSEDGATEGVNLGTAANYAVLAQSAISSTGTTMITGDIALSPAAGTYVTGFSETLDVSNNFATSAFVTGQIFASDYSLSTGTILTTAVSDMQNAYLAGVGFAADQLELFAGDLSGQTMTAGVYNWTNSVSINSDLTLNGSSTDVWVFQIAGTLSQALNTNIILSGGASAANIFWLVADSVSIGVGAHTEGVIIGSTDIAMGTNSSINGRLLAQTAVTLDSVTIVEPA